jgi:hypothetical protein
VGETESNSQSVTEILQGFQEKEFRAKNSAVGFAERRKELQEQSRFLEGKKSGTAVSSPAIRRLRGQPRPRPADFTARSPRQHRNRK